MVCKSISLNDLGLNLDNIWAESGSRGFLPDKSTLAILEDVNNEICRRCFPEYCFSVCRNTGYTETSIEIDGKVFHSGVKISECLRDAEYFVVYIATAGAGFETYRKELEESGDFVKAFFADMIGSSIAEKIGARAYKDIEAEQTAKGMKLSYSYSPGQCGWQLSDQKTLFSLFPSAPCGVILTDSSLMLPIKSISSVVGVGRNLKKRQSSCAMCTLEGCFRKKANQ